MRFIKLFFILLSTIATILAFAENNITCRVQNVNGVSRLVLNGKPVRARMLYVSPLYFQLASPIIRTAYDDTDVQTFIEIPALEKEVSNASIEFKAYKNFKAKIYNLTITEANTNKQIYALSMKGDHRVKTKRANATFKTENDREFLEVSNAFPTGFSKIIFNGVNFEANKTYKVNIDIRAEKKFTFNLYSTINGNFFEPKQRSFVGTQVAFAKEYDCNFITFPIQAADFMPEDGKSYNTENLKSALDEILTANPNAKILVRIRCYPPEWWVKKYPEDTFRYPNGEILKKYKGAGSTFSERFRRDSAKAIEAIIDFCENYCGASIIGYHPGGAHSCEWFFPDVGKEDWIGYEESAQVSWRKWLTKKYKTDKQLQLAWNNPTITLATARVPLPEERKKAFCLINPKTQQNLLDCNLFRQDAMVDTILYLAKTIRKKVPNKLSGAFYGYIIITDPKGAANPGHFGLGRLLKSDAIDFLCGPVAYSNRDLGDGCMFPGSPETVNRSGKMWIAEDDIRTHRTPQTQSKVSKIGKELRTLEDTLKVLQRNLAQEAIRNCGNWYMDMAGVGWYADPKLFELMKKFETMEMDMIKNPIPYSPDVAIIVDELSACHGGADNTNNRTMSCAARTRTFITSLSAPYGSYLLNDYLYGKPLSPKLSIFTVACALDKKARKTIFEKTRNNGAVFVWNTGIINTQTREIDLNAVYEATGFKVKLASKPMGMFVKSTPEGIKAGLHLNWGTKAITEPLLVPILKDNDKVLATYENGEPAIVIRGKHMFCAMAFLTTELLDIMYKVAEVHKYSKQKVCIFANGAYISVTCTDNDTSPHDINLNIPSNKDIYNAITGEKIGKAPNITLKMKRGDNIVLRLGNGNADFRQDN
ncbi:MAG: hypothetical protein E7035_05045 [Verrucomicrobiaceae bacterium]|nr:hypothetical protein [Verrucomicrobiaceae bacterium]